MKIRSMNPDTTNVILIEPNEINNNYTEVDGEKIYQHNGIPQYQDMYIFAELTATSKGRTIIKDSNVNSTKSKIINFIGNNQNNDNPDNPDPNYLNFTTNYYDGSTESETHYEGFGINNIKIVINSSFIPQVNIQFVDLRGLAFFNQKDSPYRILFDFPPPIFELTVKGQYGKPLKYSLHLVKYTSEFSAQNGNFIIDAQFVAMTFAPLSDVLFRYVVNTPLIDKKDSLNPSTNTPPNNTFELILKLKSLYAALSELRNTDDDIKEYMDAVNDVKKINEIINTLNDYTENAILNDDGVGTPLMIARPPSSKDYTQYPAVPNDTKDSVTPLNTVQGFDTYISQDSSTGKKARMTNTLYIAYQIGRDFPGFPTENYSGFETALNKYKEMLLGQKLSATYYDTDDIIKPDHFVLNYDVQNKTSVNTKYYGMDITGYYTRLYKKKAKLDKEIVELEDDVIAKINSLVARELGMRPSIYNIFNVILGDVDAFFDKLKTISNEAYTEHNKNKHLIINSGNYGEGKGVDTNTKSEIFAFPLIINSSHNNREERVAPIDLAEKTRFPELELVDDFIDTFLEQKIARIQYELRDNQNDSGENNWIPISPFDSTLGGATPQSPYAGTNDNVRDETLKLLLTRFYILTQGTIPQSFYEEPTGRRRDKESVIASAAYSSLYGQAEAINLISSITNEQNRLTLETMSKDYIRTNLEQFYTDIAKLTVTYDDGTPDGKIGSLSNFPTNDPKQFSVTPKSTTEGRVYLDKYNANFEGVVIHDGDLKIQDTSKESDNPVDNFSHDAGKGKWYIQDPAESFFAFTSENLLYIRDWSKVSEDFMINSGGQICTFTRYLCDQRNKYLTPPHSDVKNFRRSSYFPGHELEDDDAARQTIAYQEGNESFTYNKKSDENFLNKGADLLALWVGIFSNYDDEIINTIEGSSNLGSVVLLSNFGYTLSPFNIYPTALNPTVFDTPAAIEVPPYYAPYIGALLTANEEGWVDEILDYFTGGTGSQFLNRGFFVLADLHDVEIYLSEEDKITFKREYTTYMRTGGVYNTSVENIRSLYDVVALKPTINKLSQYWYYLNPKGEKVEGLDGNQGQSANIIAEQLTRENIINYSQITFKMTEEYDVGYTSIETLNLDASNKEKNRQFFTALFQKFNSLVITKGQEIKDREAEFGKIKGGNDIKNQLYYSFKNINDKWLTGTAKGVPNYPFNGPSNKLMDMFAFVDRGMNPIGETILNAEILIDMLEDPNISLFSVLTQLLSLNGFEFFPLQNFMRIDDEKAWESSFKTHTAGYDDVENTFFVCMYLGGSSSYPTTSGNGFTNDGIVDISAPGVKGFNSVKPNKEEIAALKKQKFDSLTENQKQILNEDFPFQEVRAFRVRFGEQNQSMFSDIKIDSKEYPETNESIQILSRIAGDGSPNAPVPQGQSLYNLYENRSYRAVVTGLGNAMIQPTQYFQLENIPLFNGAYIILDVEHNITANKMTTTFGGTKLLKYPVPRVTTPVSFMNLENLTGGEFLQAALKFATESTFVTQTTLDRHKAGLGVDLSKANGVPDWAAAKSGNVTYAIIKITEGMSFYDGSEYDMAGSVQSAINNGIEVGYYHLARFDRGTNPKTDGIDDANNCITNLAKFDKSRLPIALDIEELSFGPDSNPANTKWTGNLNANINTFVGAFLDTMTAAGYKSMLYVRTTHLIKWELTNYYHYPIWVAQWMSPSPPNNVEMSEPATPKEWKNGWDAWQFSHRGIVKGIEGGVDINIIKHELLYT